MFLSRHTLFCEDSFPFSKQSKVHQVPSTPILGFDPSSTFPVSQPHCSQFKQPADKDLYVQPLDQNLKTTHVTSPLNSNPSFLNTNGSQPFNSSVISHPLDENFPNLHVPNFNSSPNFSPPSTNSNSKSTASDTNLNNSNSHMPNYLSSDQDIVCQPLDTTRDVSSSLPDTMPTNPNIILPIPQQSDDHTLITNTHEVSTMTTSMSRDLPSTSLNTHSMVTRSKAGISKPNRKYCLSAQEVQESEPISYKDALRHNKWKQAMDDEFNALQNQQTWELVPSESSQRLIGCKWIFKLKRDSTGK